MKKLVSWILTFAMLFSLCSTAFAADNATLTVTGDSDGNIKAGDVLEVTVTVPPVTGTSGFCVQIEFDTSVLTVTELDLPATVAGKTAVVPTVAEANSSGTFSVVVAEASNFDMTEALVMKAKLTVNSGVTPGAKTNLIKVSDTEYYFEDEEGSSLTAPAFTTSTYGATVLKAPLTSVYAVVDTPVKGSPLDTSVDVGGTTAYTGEVTWYEGKTATGTPVSGDAKAKQEYTAKIVLTAAEGENFAETLDDKTTTEGYAIARTDATHLTLTKTFGPTDDKNALKGTVTIDNTAPKYGDALAAQTGSLNYNGEDAGTLSYQWYRGTTAISGAISANYTVVEADIDQTIKVEVKNSNNSGSVTSAPTSAVAKADGPTAPAVPTVTKTSNTVTVSSPVATNEYAINTSNSAPADGWKSGTTVSFADLTPNTGYYVFARVKETATTKASTASTAANVTTDKGTADSALQATLRNALTPYNGTYDKAAHNAFTVGTLPSGWTATYSTTESGTYGAMPQVTNVANSAQIWVKFSHADYSDYKTSYQVTVTAKSLTDSMVTLGTAPTYSGNPEPISITVKDGAALTKDTDYTVSGTTALTDVAASAVTVTITGKGNYSGTVNKTWNLQKATPVITAVDSKSIVKNVATSLGATIAPGTLPLSYASADTSKVTVSDDGQVTGVALTGETPVTVTVSFAGNGNYNPASKTVAVTVTDKTPVTVTFADATSQTYTGSAFQLGAQFTAATVDGGKTLTGYKYGGNTYNTLDALKAVEVTNAGTYTVTAYYETETEYGEASASFTINKADQAALSITSANIMKYGEKLTLTTTGGSGDGAVTYTFTNGTGSAALNVDELTATGAGTVTVTATKAGDANYNPSTATQTITIGKADQTITASPVSATYGDTNAKVTATTSGNGTISYAVKSGSGDYIDVAADGTLNIKKVGTAYVTVTAGATDNFNSATEEVTVTIAPKAITAPAADTKTYTYNGKEQTYGVTETDDYTVTGGTKTDAGTYTVTVSLKDPANTKWDDDSTANKTFDFVINKATITITAKPKTAYVGDAEPVLGVSDYTVEGLAEGESLKTAPTIAYALTPDMTKAGTFPITVSGAEAPDGGNYNEISYVNGTLTIITKSSGSSGGGGGGSTTYTITVDSAKNGAVTSSHKSAAKGTTVTITVKPDKGFELDTLKVVDKDGDKVKLTEKNGKYTFTMPASKVTVKATFAEIEVPEVNPFTDVKEGAYYYDAVLWAVENGITGGTTATTFSPNASCTRAQAVTFLWRAAGSPAPKSSVNPFTDVKESAYYYEAVLWAAENGITGGTTATTFSPNATCTRAQIVTFLWRSQKSPAADTVNPFTDVAADSYYANAVLWAAENGITGGTSATTFSPNNDCTRAQIVTFLFRCLGE